MKKQKLRIEAFYFTYKDGKLNGKVKGYNIFLGSILCATVYREFNESARTTLARARRINNTLENFYKKYI